MDAVFLIQFANSLVSKFARLNVQIRESMDSISILTVAMGNSMGFTLLYVSRRDWLLVGDLQSLLQNLRNLGWVLLHVLRPLSFCVDFKSWIIAEIISEWLDCYFSVSAQLKLVPIGWESVYSYIIVRGSGLKKKKTLLSDRWFSIYLYWIEITQYCIDTI